MRAAPVVKEPQTHLTRQPGSHMRPARAIQADRYEGSSSPPAARAQLALKRGVRLCGRGRSSGAGCRDFRCPSGNHLREPPCRLSQAPQGTSGTVFAAQCMNRPGELGVNLFLISPYKRGVTGSNPVAPTFPQVRNPLLSGHMFIDLLCPGKRSAVPPGRICPGTPVTRPDVSLSGRKGQQVRAVRPPARTPPGPSAPRNTSAAEGAAAVLGGIWEIIFSRAGRRRRRARRRAPRLVGRDPVRHRAAGRPVTRGAR